MVNVKEISYKEAVDFILPRHYSGRKPNIMHSFGYYEEGILKAVVTYGKPASNQLCEGVCGKQFKNKVIELNRVVSEEIKVPITQIISRTLKMIKKEEYIIISYADTAMNHKGYIYQALNFIYTGKTKQRTDKYAGENKHSRHYDKESSNEIRQVRSSKHRYILFNCSKTTKKVYKNNLKYKIEDYPKGDNDRYVLGEFLKPKLIKTKI